MIEVYWANTQDGQRRAVEFAEDDARLAKAFGTWLASTDGIVGESVRVALPEQRGRHAAGQHIDRAIVDEVTLRESVQLDPASKAYAAMIAAHDAVCPDRGCDPMTMGIFQGGRKPLTPEGSEIALAQHRDRRHKAIEAGEPERPDPRYAELVGKRVRVTLDRNPHDPMATVEGVLVGCKKDGEVGVFTEEGLRWCWPALEIEAL